MDNSIKLKTKYRVKVDLADNPLKVHYQIYDEDNDLEFSAIDEMPTVLGERTKIMKQIKSVCKDKKEFQYVVKRLKKIVSNLQHELEMKEVEEQQQKDLEIRKKVHHAEKTLKEIQHPLRYIGTIIDWLTAGERINTLLCFTAGCSQIILKKPISVIGYGESASGKTLIQKTALSFLPEEYIVSEKQVSPAALFNRSKTDEFFYDGKIVCYGDMGGENDKENQQESFDLMKELQSDGKLSKPVSVKEDNSWITVDLELKGTPSVWYTTVPQDIDSQELSRAILFTPRTDNQMIFNKRGNALSYEVGKTYSRYEEVKELAKDIQYMVLHLKQVMEDKIIINPYFDVISNMLRNSKFYKRDTEKYVNLLKTITALNYYHREKYKLPDGRIGVITSSEDVCILLALLEPYTTSIAHNIKPTSAKIYTKLLGSNDEKGFAKTLKYDGDEFQDGFTARDYFERSGTDLSLRSVQRYFSDLYQSGLLKVVSKDKNANVYDVIEINLNDDFQDYELDFDFITYELGGDIADLIRNDSSVDKVDIFEKDVMIGGVPW